MARLFWDQVEEFHQKVSGHSHGPAGLHAIRYLRSLMEPNWDERQSRIHPIANELLWAANVQYFRLMILEQKLRIASTLSGFGHVRSRLGEPDKYTDAMAEIDTAFRMQLRGLVPRFAQQKQDAQTADLFIGHGHEPRWVEVTSVNPPEQDFDLSYVHTLFRIAVAAKVNISGIIVKPKNAAVDSNFLRSIQDAAQKSSSSHEVVRENKRGAYTLYLFPGDLRAEVPKRYSDGIITRGSRQKPHVMRVLRTLEDKCQMEYKGSGYVVIFDRIIGDNEFVSLAESGSGEVRDFLQAFPQVQGAALISTRIGNPQTSWNPVNSEASNVDVYTLPSLDSEGLIQWENDSADTELPDSLSCSFAEFKSNLTSFLTSKGICFSGKY